MFKSLAKWHWKRQRQQLLLDKAVSHFETTEGKRAIKGMCSIIARQDDCIVVRICYDSTRPPSREWYQVKENESISKLTFEQAEAFGERHWR
jgi:hypothetical protein